MVERELISPFDVDNHNWLHLLYIRNGRHLVLGSSSPEWEGGGGARGNKMTGLVKMYRGPVVEVRRRAESDRSLPFGRSVRPRPSSARAHRTLLVPVAALEGESSDTQLY